MIHGIIRLYHDTLSSECQIRMSDSVALHGIKQLVFLIGNHFLVGRDHMDF